MSESTSDPKLPSTAADSSAPSPSKPDAAGDSGSDIEITQEVKGKGPKKQQNSAKICNSVSHLRQAWVNRWMLCSENHILSNNRKW